jgi:hypothetical protein
MNLPDVRKLTIAKAERKLIGMNGLNGGQEAPKGARFNGKKVKDLKRFVA